MARDIVAQGGKAGSLTDLIERPGKPPILAFVEPDGTRIPFAALHGAEGARERAEEAHRAWSQAWAAKQAVKAHGSPLLKILRKLGARHDEVRFGNGKVDTASILPRYLVGRDPYKAAREIETDFHIDGDEAFYEQVKRLVASSASLASSEAALSNGALNLQAAQRGPDTALSRFVAETIGAPPAVAPVAVEPEDHPEEIGICLGTILVVTDCGYGPFESTVVASFDPAMLEFDGEGSIEGAYLALEVKYDYASLGATRDRFAFQDGSILEAVKTLMRERGLPDDIGWSERGMQRTDAGDVEVGYDIAERLWPDVVSAKRSEAASAKGVATAA